MTVHALIPVFNRLDMTRRMLDDLRGQRDADVRIVVIDDGSTDGTAEWLAAQRDVLTIRGNGNLWWAGAVDAALRQILPEAPDEDYVLFLNNDTTVEPDFVATLVRVSRQHRGAAVGTALRDLAPPHEFISIGPRMNVWHMHVWDLIDDLSPEERRAPKAAYEVDALSGRGTLYPVPVLRATGYLHPKLLPHYRADYELAARARRKGFRTLASTEAAVYTERDFGVLRRDGSRWRRWFHRGSPSNLVQRLAFHLLVGTALQRSTAIPRILFDMVWRLLPPRVRFAVHVCSLLFRMPFSGQARARVLMYLPPRLRGASANPWHPYRAGTLIDVYGKNVLVVGCNRGTDCAFFVRLGAAAVDGLDAIDEVGTDYQHRRVRYVRACAEAIPAPSNTYDLVFCSAMKSVRDIERALAEMARVARPGGLIYIASPPWNSGYGGHKANLLPEVEMVENNIPGASKGAGAAQIASEFAFIARKRAAISTACAS